MKKETATKELKKKCGFTLPVSVLETLAQKVEETKHSRSKIVSAILAHGLPFYPDRAEMEKVQVERLRASEGPIAAEPTGVTVAQDLVPDPMSIKPKDPSSKKAGHVYTPPSAVPSFVTQTAVGQPGQAEATPPASPPSMPSPGYVPNFQPRGPADQPTPEIGVPAASFDPQLIAMFQQFMAQMAAGPSLPTAAPAPLPIPPPQGFNTLPTPAPPQFAASYPPGYTGPPGVAPAPVPQLNPGMYGFPEQEMARQPQPPAYMQDAWAMNMGAPAAAGGVSPGPTSQGLLGGQMMTPNLSAPSNNINMRAANQALGPGWRQNLRRITAADRRE